MRIPSFDHDDYWELVSAEERHAESPDSFWIPTRSERESLKIGQTAKLLFEIESENEEGEVERNVERMWVVVSEIDSPYYIGRLANKPATVDEHEDFYLQLGVEVPFKAEHVIDIDQPPAEFLEKFFSEQPKGIWPRV